MGCASSTDKRCKNCKEPLSPARRSLSLHRKPANNHVHSHSHSHHVVALTSSTLGSLKLEPSVQNHVVEEHEIGKNSTIQIQQTIAVDVKKTLIGNVDVDKEKDLAKNEFAMGMIEAKTWSKMIDVKIPSVVPRTPTRTPPGEPETINAWEMMEGLEDISPLRQVNHHRSFSFDVSRICKVAPVDDQPTPKVKENESSSPKPVWLDLVDSESNENSIASAFDPEVIATFRRSLEELPPTNPFHLKPLEEEKQGEESKVNVNSKNIEENCENDEVEVNCEKSTVRGTDKLIVYFTSLRGVRKTYEDCCHVRVILNGLGVKVDERDMSMHSGFKDELKELLGDEFNKGGLPRVFLGRRYIGGAEEIRQLNEEGKLEKMMEGCELVDDGSGNGKGCEACGDIRFVPCETCSGSCKIYSDGDYGDEEEDEEVDGSDDHEGGFHRCPDCNENGLIRCPICCD